MGEPVTLVLRVGNGLRDRDDALEATLEVLYRGYPIALGDFGPLYPVSHSLVFVPPVTGAYVLRVAGRGPGEYSLITLPGGNPDANPPTRAWRQDPDLSPFRSRPGY
jgi:hypothetical protein